MHGPQPECTQQPLLEPGPPDREGLAGRPTGPVRHEPRCIDPALETLLDRECLQVSLVGDGDASQIGDGPDVLRLDPVALEQPAVVRHAMVGVRDEPAQSLVLKGNDVRALRTRMRQ
jgi:hypothetical protein